METTSPNDFIDIDQWLDTHPTTTVRKLIGNPSFKPLPEISPEALENEIDKILDLLAEFRINVDMEECSSEQAYTFLTSEIMDSEIEDPPAPGWWNCFMYALFHPDAGDASGDADRRANKVGGDGKSGEG